MRGARGPPPSLFFPGHPYLCSKSFFLLRTKNAPHGAFSGLRFLMNDDDLTGACLAYEARYLCGANMWLVMSSGGRRDLLGTVLRGPYKRLHGSRNIDLGQWPQRTPEFQSFC